MGSSKWGLTCLALFVTLTVVTGDDIPSHLPPVPPGVFNVNASILINAPIEKVWHTLLDFPSYPEWNPFVRSQLVTDALGIPLEDQVPQEGLHLTITAHIPPLEGPVDASTPSNPGQTYVTKDIITHVNTPEQYQTAWKTDSPPEVLDAERWSAVSEVELDSGVWTLYESREVYHGALASTVEATVGEGLIKGFKAQAVALKARVESDIDFKS